jgi:hypothetical protein
MEYDTTLLSVRPEIIPTTLVDESQHSDDIDEDQMFSPKVNAVSSRLKNLEKEISTFTMLNEAARKEVDSMPDMDSEIEDI